MTNHVQSRRGLATVLVLGILAIAMALSYSVMRSQTTAVQIQTNTRHSASARMAAMTGISAALRKMHELSWAGVETSFTAAVNASDRYTVSYTTGDSSLLPADAKYAEFPFRVTVVSTGYSQDAASNITASHAIRAVVRLNPVRTATPPAGWSTAQNYTVFQTGNADFKVDVPMRIQGRVRIQGTFYLAEDNNYGWSSGQRRDYFDELSSNHRPFTNQIDIPSARLSSTDATLLSEISITTLNVAESLLPSWAVSSGTYNYRLYPGGKQYTAQSLASTLSSVTVIPNPLTNPAGVFQVNGNVTLNNNVSLQGTLITTASSTIDVRGTGINLTPVNLPAVSGSTLPVRLPTIVGSDDLRVREGSNATITGLVYVGDKFEVDEGSQMSPFNLNGRLIARDFVVEGRTEYMDADWHVGLLEALLSLLGLLNRENLDTTPRIRFTGEGTPLASYHWSPTAGTIYEPDPLDAGLRWDLVSWSDGAN